jgi:hypothetical protein
MREEYCPYCGALLVYEDTWFYQRKLRGYIYRCPNHEGFESEEDLKAYEQETGLKHSEEEPLTCASSMFHVSGSFYTDGDSLREGYPC